MNSVSERSKSGQYNHNPLAMSTAIATATGWGVRFHFVASHQEFSTQDSEFRIDSQQLTPESAARLDVLN
jgi:hypothetical protein